MAMEKPARNEAVDFWRGLALVMIFINHIPDNPLTHLTLRRWGMADSAEIFVFLAGVTAAMTIGRRFDRNGLRAGLIYCLRRIWRLFCAHIMLVFGLLAIVAWAGRYIDSAPVKQQFNFLPFFLDLDRALVKLVHFAYMPSMTDILPLYIVMLVLFPLFWLLRRRSWWLPVLLSGAVWLYASGFGFAPNEHPPELIWQFNPLAWQFIFMLGMALHDRKDRLLALLRNKIWVVAAAAIVMFGFLAAAPWVIRPEHESWRVIPPQILRYDNKIDLSLLRLLDFLALCFLSVRFWPQISARTPMIIRRVLCLLGRNALLVFSAGTLLSLTFYLMQRHFGLGNAGYIIFSLAGIAMMAALAYSADAIRRFQRAELLPSGAVVVS